MALETKNIRNIALVGHTGSGKTMLGEAMLCAGGVLKELGSIEKGTTVSDHLPEEHEAQRSVCSSTLNFPWKDCQFNLIDTPGYADFSGHAYAALAGVETALIAVNAVNGVEVATRKMWDAAEKAGVTRMFVATRLDGDNARFDELVEQLKSLFGAAVQPVTIPRGLGRSFKGVSSLMNPDAELDSDADAARQALIESAISADDALLEKYLGGEEIPPAALEGAMRAAIASGALVPVISVASLAGDAKKSGVGAALDFLKSFAPDPLDARPKLAGTEGGVFEPKADGPLVARVFKIMSDDYVGKVSFFRIYQGGLKAGTVVTLPNGSTTKVAKLYRFQGKDQEEVPATVMGDIVATARIDALQFGMTVGEEADGPQLQDPAVPKPMIERAVEPKTRGDEGKISGALRKLADEDPTFEWRQDPQTKETVVSGMGDRHLKVIFERMKRRFQLEIVTRPPKIAYHETIVGKADVRYRHKKQSGGAGQFAECAIRIEPNARGAGYEFIDDIFGGAIDLQYRPSVDKGVQSKMAQGILAGFPVVDIKVSLYDGKTHPVDSKDIAFQVAGRKAISEAFMKANPVLLEPIANMEIVAPSRFMGDITGNIASRRGRIVGMETLGDMQVVKAHVPVSEVQTYSSELQSLTGGEGYFSMEPSHYDVVPSNVAQQVIAQYAKDKKEEDE
jgi:elongation factor G